MTGRGGFVQDLRTVLRGRDFRALFATRLTSQAGDGAFQAGLASLLFFSPERAATAGAAAAAFAVSILPYTVVGPVAGVLLDRWRRRQILLVANLVRTVLVLGIAGLVAGGVVGPLLWAAALVSLSVNRFFLAGLGTSLPHVVPADELVMANAVSPTSGTVAALVGGGCGYAVRLAAGPGDRSDALVLVLAAGCYLAAALLALRMAPGLLGPDLPQRGTGHVRGVLQGVAQGARHVRERPFAVHALTVVGAHRLALGLTTVATILICRNYLSDPADPDAGLALLGVVVGATGAGYAAAALVTPVAVARAGIARWVVASSALAALAQTAVAVHLSVPVLLVAGFVLGVGVQSTKICVDAVLQGGIRDAFLGRVFSFYDIVFNAAFVAAAALAALVLPPDGVSPLALAAAGLLYAGAAAGYSAASRGTQSAGSITLRS